MAIAQDECNRADSERPPAAESGGRCVQKAGANPAASRWQANDGLKLADALYAVGDGGAIRSAKC